MVSVEVAPLLRPTKTRPRSLSSVSSYSSSVVNPATFETLCHVVPTWTGPVPFWAHDWVPGSHSVALAKSLR